MELNLFSIVRYDSAYEREYAELYLPTWRVEPYGEHFEPQNVISHLEKNRSYLFLLLENKTNQVVGFVGGRALSKECDFFDNQCQPKVNINKAFYIDELGVAESHKKFGWGQMLMHFLISTARENKFSEFVLRTHASETNPAKKLYSKLGFSTRKDNEGNIHSVDTEQDRIDGRPKIDRRIYYYKIF